MSREEASEAEVLLEEERKLTEKEKQVSGDAKAQVQRSPGICTCHEAGPKGTKAADLHRQLASLHQVSFIREPLRERRGIGDQDRQELTPGQSSLKINETRHMSGLYTVLHMRQDMSLAFLPISLAHIGQMVQVQAKKEEVKKKLKERRVPSSPIGRVAGFAQLGASLVYGTVADQVRRPSVK